MSRPEDFWIEMSGLFGHEESPQQNVYNRLSEKIEQIQEAEGATRANVLDVGCNICRLGDVLFSRGVFEAGYQGWDSNPTAVWFSEEKKYDASVVNLRNPHAVMVQIVVLKDVIEHLESYEVMDALLRVVQPNHVLIASFIPWGTEPTLIKLEPAGYYMNAYNQDDVVNWFSRQGYEWVGSEKLVDANQNENMISHFRRPVAVEDTPIPPVDEEPELPRKRKAGRPKKS